MELPGLCRNSERPGKGTTLPLEHTFQEREQVGVNRVGLTPDWPGGCADLFSMYMIRGLGMAAF